jgi:Lrp/AsnC family transcriptional regulator, leucine-responsive regulatory protein
MDAIDRKILECVQRDGALTYAEIGAAAGLSASTVNDRLKRLRADGVLRRMTAEIDPAAVDLKLLAFVMVVVEAGISEDVFRAGMLTAPEVLECHHVTGEFSYLLKLRLRDTAQLEAFLTNTLKPLTGFGRTQTLIALSSTKETHILSPLHSGGVSGPHKSTGGNA